MRYPCYGAYNDNDNFCNSQCEFRGDCSQIPHNLEGGKKVAEVTNEMVAEQIAKKLESVPADELLESIFGEGEQAIRELASHYDIDMSVADDENYLAVAICTHIELGAAKSESESLDRARAEMEAGEVIPKEEVVDEITDGNSGVGVSEPKPSNVKNKEVDVGGGEDSGESKELGDVPELNCEPGQIGDDPLLAKAGTIEVAVEPSNAVTELLIGTITLNSHYIGAATQDHKDRLFEQVKLAIDVKEPEIEEVVDDKPEPTTATELFDKIADGYSLSDLYYYVDLTEDNKGNWWASLIDANPDDYPELRPSKRNPNQLRTLFWDKNDGKVEVGVECTKRHIENMVEQYSGVNG